MDAQPVFARLADITGIARLFPEAAQPGHAEDNGALLDLIIRALPADRLYTATAAVRALASTGVTPVDCAQPLTGYREALESGHILALEWYWTRDAASATPGKIFRTALPSHMCGNPRDGNTSASILAAHGHLAALKLARHYGCPWGDVEAGVCAYAAAHGHLEVLQYARASVCPWGSGTCAMAAMCGHLEVLRWARANGCPWDRHACAFAAEHGHLGILQWLRAQTPPCLGVYDTCASAAAGGHLEVLQWARAQGHPGD